MRIGNAVLMSIPAFAATIAGSALLLQLAEAQAPTTEMQSATAPPASEEQQSAVEELYRSVKKPTTTLEILQNLKVVMDHDLLFREDFYTEDNLKQFFGGEKVV